MRIRRGPAILAAIVLAASGSALAEYDLVDLGTLRGGAAAHAAAINNAGQVVGWGFVQRSNRLRAFLSEEGRRLRALGTLGGFGSVARDINGSGMVIGSADTSTETTHAFLWTRGEGMQDLGTLGGGYSNAADINDRGQIVGRAVTASGVSHAFLWSEGTMHDLGTLGGDLSSASAINEIGHVVGSAWAADRLNHAFLWTPEVGMIDLGTLGGYSSDAVDINDRDEVTGRSYNPSSERRAFHWANGVMTDLGAFAGGEPEPADINNRGQIVGSGGPGAFLWSAECGMRLLADSDTPSHAAAINDAGFVTGSIKFEGREDVGQVERAAVWTVGSSCTGPSTLLPDLGSGKSEGSAINAAGTVAGDSLSAVGRIHAVLWKSLP